MTPDTHASLSGGSSEVTALLRTLAAAPDWRSFCEALERSLPGLLPSTRLDVYEVRTDGGLTLRFTTDAQDTLLLQLAATDVKLRYQLQREGYGAIITLPLIGDGKRYGWLALARKQGRLGSAAQSLADQLAPLIALWLRYDGREAELAASTAHARRLEQQLHDTATLRLRATLAAGAAHDIGNLFTSMMGYAQILQQDLPAPYQSDISMIVRVVEDARQLLRRLQSTDVTAEPASSSTLAFVPQIIRDVVKLTRPLWERRAGIHVEMTLEDAPAVRMPTEELREVLVNLMMNAITAVDEGGTITLCCHNDGGHAIIAVSDTGAGVAREHHSAIFQPFVTTRLDGSGLGLSVSRALIESYSGTLSVDSEPGQGATFRISLPIAS
jgi:signal transduction histidine kinase